MAEPKPDWVRWYPAKWLSGVLHLTNEQRGVYVQVINVIMDLGECSAEPRYLGRLCNLRSHAATRIVGELVEAGKLILENGKLHQNRAETEVKLARKSIEKGRLMANERWKNKRLADAASICKPESRIQSLESTGKTQSPSREPELFAPDGARPSASPPNGTDAPVPARAALWAEMKAQIGGSNPGALIGRWCRLYGEPAVYDAHFAAMSKPPADYVPWITARLKSATASGQTAHDKTVPRQTTNRNILDLQEQGIDPYSTEGDGDHRKH